VSFSALKTSQNILLTPGLTGVLNKSDGKLSLDDEDHTNVLAWKEKRLIFKKSPLREVIKVLKNYFKAEIHIEDQQLLNCRFTGSFEDPTLDEVIETIQLSLNLKVLHESDSYTLQGEGCNIN
jgi:ferric-dicitrate binding protein FerR (iron transport regulator)